MNYPLLSEYCSAVKEAADNFDQLQHLRPVLDAQGEPVVSSGNFAVVFKMYDAQTGKDVAVKCFLKEQEGRAASYRLISQELSFVSSNFLTPIRYLENELFVASNSTEDEEFPVVLMDWIEGETLDRYVVSHLQDAYALQKLAFQFSQLASWLMSQPFAHGDLKPDNILVRPDGSLVLVDYDGMFVPAMQGQQSRELGSPDFRHPQRTSERFNDHIDDFALTVILLSLKALSLRPSLWNDFAAADRLLFSAADYRDLSACALLKVLPELFTDAELVRIYGLFLLAHAGGDLAAVSFRLLNLSFPEELQVDETTELSTIVTDEDKEHGFLDEFGVLYSKDGLRLLKANDKLNEYTVREGTRVVCNDAFFWCFSLTNITLPEGLTTIGELAFCDCSSLTNITLPEGLITIGDSAFYDCSSLTNITFPDGLITIGDWAFYGCSSLTNITLPEGLTTIGKSAFSCCSSLTNIALPEGLTTIGDRAFRNCPSLTNIALPEGLTTIGDLAFSDCSSLTNITLPEGLTTIGDLAFSVCSSLTNITLPSSLTCIGSNPFRNCVDLMLNNNSPHFKVIDGMLLGSEGTHLITYFGKGTEFIVPVFVKSIGNLAFSGCRSLTNITLPEGLITIGDLAFSGCSSLTSLALPSSLTCIGRNPFSGCENLMIYNNSPHFKVIDGMLLGSEGTHLITYFGKGTKIIVPVFVKSIGYSAFSGCSSLTNITLPDGLITIGDLAFSDCI